MASADIEEFLVEKKIFWVKMGLIVLLVINGVLMQKSETRVLLGAADAGGTDDTVLWKKMGAFARVSMLLWVVITIVGVFLAG